MNNYELTIKLPIRTYQDGPIDCDALTFMLNSIMDDWDNGRRPFEVEMLRNGLSRCLKWAASDVIAKQKQEEFGNEMVGDETRSTARWVIEADKEKPVTPDFFNSFKVEITEQ